MKEQNKRNKSTDIFGYLRRTLCGLIAALLFVAPALLPAHHNAKADAQRWVYSAGASSYTFTAPETGSYKIEAYGAAGSVGFSRATGGGAGNTFQSFNNVYDNGKGGYSSGYIELEQGEKLTLYIAESPRSEIPQGSTSGNINLYKTAFNGYAGGRGISGYSYSAFSSGGANYSYIGQGAPATAVYSEKDKAYVLITGGGGGGKEGTGGNGGGLVGGNGSVHYDERTSQSPPAQPMYYGTTAENNNIVGKGGTQSANGAAGVSNKELTAWVNNYNNSGKWEQGPFVMKSTNATGANGANNTGNNWNVSGGGGGGGGYRPGGGGTGYGIMATVTWSTSNTYYYYSHATGGGGGGSSWSSSRIKDAAHFQGVNPGHGFVVITRENIDNTPPVVNSVTKTPSGWTNGNVQISVDFTAPESGMEGNLTSPLKVTAQTNKTYSGTLKANNGTAVGYSAVVDNIDKLSPSAASVAQSTTVWTKDDITLTLTAQDASATADYGKSGMAQKVDVSFKPKTGAVTESTFNGTVTGGNLSGAYTAQNSGDYTFTVYDVAGNSYKVTKTVTNIDNTPPIINATASTTPTTGSVTITMTATDTESGLSPQTPSPKTIVATENGVYTYEFVDNVGNVSVCSYEVKNIDRSEPDIAVTASTLPPLWTNGYTNGSSAGFVIVTATAYDLGGISLAPGQTAAVTDIYGVVTEARQSKTVDENTSNITFMFTDLAGNENTESYSVQNMDKLKPIINVTSPDEWTNTSVTITAEATDYGGSNLDMSETPETQTMDVTENGVYSFTAKDNAGNETVKSHTVSRIDRTAPSIEFTSPTEQVAEYKRIITLKDNHVTPSGIRSLRINGVIVHEEAETSGKAVVTYEHNITANGMYVYEVIDFAGNVTSAASEFTYLNTPVDVFDVYLRNYSASFADESGETVYAIGKSIMFSDVLFTIADTDASPSDTWAYAVELLNGAGNSVFKSEKTGITKSAAQEAIASSVFYVDGSGSALPDGEYTVRVTVKDNYGAETSVDIPLFIKKTLPPKPVIDAQNGYASISYPSDLLEQYSQKTYSYNGHNGAYTLPIPITADGRLTATYKDIAGGVSMAFVELDKEAGGEFVPDIEKDILPPFVDGSDGMDETRNAYFYYVNTRKNEGMPKNTELLEKLSELLR